MKKYLVEVRERNRRGYLDLREGRHEGTSPDDVSARIRAETPHYITWDDVPKLLKDLGPADYGTVEQFIERWCSNKEKTNMPTEMTRAQILMSFFGKSEGQDLKGFNEEIKALSPDEKQEIVELAAKEMGVTIKVS